MSASSARGERRRFDDGNIIRAAFFAMLAGTACVLYVDFRELTAADSSAYGVPDVPILPAFDPSSPMPPQGPEVTTDPELLRTPLTAKLGTGGVLALTGTIDIGSAQRVAAELADYGEYVKRVALDSPGGSVEDALAIGELLRAGGFTTSVAAGAFCASSCPLVLAGGKLRQISPDAAVGVHQIYAARPAGESALVSTGNAIANAQKTTASISRYLETMGVDPAIWLHALETPPDRLYYLDGEELLRFRLATSLAN